MDTQLLMGDAQSQNKMMQLISAQMQNPITDAIEKVKLPTNMGGMTADVPFEIKKAQQTVTKKVVAKVPELTADEKKKMTKEKIAERRRIKKMKEKLEKGYSTK